MLPGIDSIISKTFLLFEKVTHLQPKPSFAVQFSSVSQSCPWTAAHQASLSTTHKMRRTWLAKWTFLKESTAIRRALKSMW